MYIYTSKYVCICICVFIINKNYLDNKKIKASTEMGGGEDPYQEKKRNNLLFEGGNNFCSGSL